MKIYFLASVLLQTFLSVQGGASRSITAAAWLDDEDGDNIPGKAGIDYPVHATVPEGTSFRCSQYEYAGYFGDQEAGCQAYHVCFPDGRNASFLCVNGTVFHQRYYVCDWWFHFDCNNALNLYELNLYRKVPLPVLPPVVRRPFPPPGRKPEVPGSAPQPGRMPSNPGSGGQRQSPKRNSEKVGPHPNRDGKHDRNKNENLPNKYPKVENKYKNPYENPNTDDKCDCQCN